MGLEGRGRGLEAVGGGKWVGSSGWEAVGGGGGSGWETEGGLLPQDPT